jgi:EmrB/QacA subfamily drug resistance transporter
LGRRRAKSTVLESQGTGGGIADISLGGTPSPNRASLPAASGIRGSGGAQRDASVSSRTLIFTICAIALFMSSIDATIVATALPRIGGALHSRLNWTGWTITIYALGEIIALPLAGKISDQFGRKKVFLVSVVVFTTASLACGLSTTIYMLVVLRFVQALGGGAFMPSATGIVADHFGADRDRGIGMFSSIFPIGSMVGPIVGGVITQYWVWRGIFFVNVPVGIALFVLAWRFIPKTAPRDSGRLDFAGVGLLSGTILVGMLTVTLLGEPGVSFTSPGIVISAICAVVLGWLFLRHTRRADAPFIPLRLLQGEGFLTMNLLNFLYGTAIFGFAVLAPLYAEDRYHLAFSQAGSVTSARGIGMIAIAAIATLALRRTGYRLPMVVGFTTIAFGLFMLSIAPRAFGPYWWLMLFSLIAGFGLGVASPATNNATMQLAPDEVGAISGIRGMFREIGGVIYIAISTTLLARSHDPGTAQAHIFVVQALILVLMTGLVYLVPNHRGKW